MLSGLNPDSFFSPFVVVVFLWHCLKRVFLETSLGELFVAPNIISWWAQDSIDGNRRHAWWLSRTSVQIADVAFHVLTSAGQREPSMITTSWHVMWKIHPSTPLSVSNLLLFERVGLDFHVPKPVRSIWSRKTINLKAGLRDRMSVLKVCILSRLSYACLQLQIAMAAAHSIDT